jgi:hypothetical protein
LAIFIAYYFGRVLEERKAQPLTLGICVPGYIMAGIFFLTAVGVSIAARKNIDFVVSLLPFNVLACLLVLIAAGIVVSLRRKRFWGMSLSLLAFPVVLLIFLSLGRPYAEPWVSCKNICDVFNTLDRSDSVVLTSKFYARGVRYYTDRKIAVIDINGEGFFSPHPIPLLNTREKVLDFLRAQPVTVAIVKAGDYEELSTLAKGEGMRLHFFQDIGGKMIVRIERTPPGP